ncbi:MAG: phosphoribosylglycinamide formyltransferase [Spirochaetales bacterium]|nr:phosphoribosylglycinamide formyltransferase [Spirochaetales bacterium]
MAEIAVLASGSGTNFQALAEQLPVAGHRVCCLVFDRKYALARERAEKLGIPAHYICYPGRGREEAEREIAGILDGYRPSLIALAGYMRLFTPWFVDKYAGKIVNIHPALLPKYPGADGITESYNSADSELGITIHFIDEGMDSGPVLRQASFTRNGSETLEEIEERIHRLEHENYASAVIDLLDKAGPGME